MKTTILTASILFILLFQFSNAQAQCDQESGVFECADIFSKDNIIFLSDFTVNKKMKKKTIGVEKWDIYLNANTRYRFAICCNAGTDGIILEIFEGENEETTVTTFINNEYTGAVDYTCKKSGNYKVVMRFLDEYKNKKKYCAIGLMGYIGKAN